jgi:hypothetical protein
MSRYLGYFAAARPFTTAIAVTNAVTVIFTLQPRAGEMS